MSEKMSETLFIKGLRAEARVGIHEHEREPQPLVFHLWAEVERGDANGIGDVVCYETLGAHIREVLAGGHIELLEQVAERVVARLLEEPRIINLRLQIEKPRAIADADCAGIEVYRKR